ncbi:MAG: FAD:protein FMN transferase [Prevotella sp.]|nr:FAD:protein FMN transferase [Prevotella sp.]
MKKWQLPFLVLLIVGTVLIIRQQQSMPYQKCSGLIFGTTYHVTYQYDDDLHAEVVAKLKEVDAALSMFNEQSTISKINNNEAVKPDKMFLDVFQLAQQISQDTQGAFDITVAPLVNIWGFGFKHGQEPTTHAIDSLRQFVGYQKVSYNGKTIQKQDPRIMLDCSAIAKGYGTDVVARLLDEKGITNYLVEIGGEVVTRGISEKRVPWKIGVTKPTDDTLHVGNDLQTVLNVTDKAMATSGNYRNFYYKGGRKYAHTIDPKTGRPVQHNILSATVLCNQCAKADAYATAFMVMGLDKAREVLERNPDLMVYFIYDDKGVNKVWYSPSLKDKIEQ